MFNFRGDIDGRHNLPKEPMLVFGSLPWFFFALLPGLVTLPFEAPYTLRAIWSLPVAYLFAGVGIAALWKTVSPLIPRCAAMVLGVPLAVGMGAIAYDNFNTYFHLQRNSIEVWGAFNPVQTAIAYRLLELLSTDYDFQLAHFLAQYLVITFLVPDGPRISTFDTAKHPPASAHGDVALMFLDRGQEPYMNLIAEFYPHRNYSRMDFGQGPRQQLIYTTELDEADIARAQGLEFRLIPRSTSSQDNVEDVQVPQIDLSWGDESTPAPPFSAEWTGILHVPEYGSYGLVLEGSQKAQLFLDGSLILEGPGDIRLPLAIGNHAIMVKDEIQESEGRTRLSWGPPKSQLSVIGPQNLYSHVQSHRLLRSYFPPNCPTALGAFQQIDSMIFFFFHRRPFSGEFIIQWQHPAGGNAAD
jgi:hypothetical protein